MEAFQQTYQISVYTFTLFGKFFLLTHFKRSGSAQVYSLKINEVLMYSETLKGCQGYLIGLTQRTF